MTTCTYDEVLIPFFSADDFFGNLTISHDYVEKKILCILDIPDMMIPKDILQFFFESDNQIVSIKICKHSLNSNKYLALVLFHNSSTAQLFKTKYHGSQLSKILQVRADLCYVADIKVHPSGSDGHIATKECGNIYDTYATLFGSSKQDLCPLCLESFLVNNGSGLIALYCSHIFHVACLIQHESLKCPVCRFQHNSRNSICQMCNACGIGHTANFHNKVSYGDEIDCDIWACLTCGFNGCGNKFHNHMYQHYQETLHNYALNLGDKRKVFDFNYDNFIDRIVLTDSTSVDWSRSETQNDSNKTETCSSLFPCLLVEYDEDLVVNSKLEKLAEQYQQILIWRMNQTRLFYDKKLKQVWDAVREDKFNHLEIISNQQLEMTDIGESTKCRKQSSKHQWTKYIKTSLHNEHTKLVKQVEVVKNKILQLQKERETLRALNKQLKLNKLELSNKIESERSGVESAKSFGCVQIAELERQVSNLMHLLESEDSVKSAPSSSRSSSRKLMLEMKSCAGSD